MFRKGAKHIRVTSYRLRSGLGVEIEDKKKNEAIKPCMDSR